MNTYSYVDGNPINYFDSLGLFKFCKRSLGNLPGWMNFNIYKDSFNLGFYHEHGFYEDGSGDNTGWGPDGLFKDNLNDSRYQCDNQQYDDDTMRKAQEIVDERYKDKDYSAMYPNCQDYNDELRYEYWRLKK